MSSQIKYAVVVYTQERGHTFLRPDNTLTRDPLQAKVFDTEAYAIEESHKQDEFSDYFSQVVQITFHAHWHWPTQELKKRD